MVTLIVLAPLSGPGHLLAQEASRSIPAPTAVTLGFEGEGFPYGDKGLTPQEIRDTFGPATEILCAAYSPDGKSLAVGDGPTRVICSFGGGLPSMNENGGLIRLVDTTTHRVRVVLGPTKVRQHEYEVQRLTFSADGKVLVAAGLENYLVDSRLVYVSSFTAWDASAGRQLYRIAGATNDRWIRSAIAANAGILAAATERVVSIWDGSTGRQRHALGDLPCRPTMLVFSPDGHALACGFEDGSVTVWDALTARRIAGFPGHERHGQRYAIGVLAFSPDGRDLAAAGTFRRDEGELYKYYSEVRIFGLADRSERATMPGRDGEIFKCLAFSPDGKTVVSGGCPGWSEEAPDRGVLRLWDAVTGVERASFTTQRQSLLGLSFSPDGRILAAADRGSIVLRDAADGAQRIVLRCETEHPPFHEPVFSPDGKTLASVDGALQLWKLGSVARFRTNR